ncbi:MAG: sigma-70 family RNA polymerase sigma factor [Tenericutes bacterium]|nr:sigma-70 family RNA polymerase sigma factor [Mycoplasmatota bacterium]
MNYDDLNDNELVYLCSENNENATIELINKYKGMILIILKDFLKKYKIVGIEISDLYQEGLIGLLNAIETYDKDRDVTFYTYANACIKSSIITTIRSTFTQKNRILNTSYSLDKMFEDSENNFYEIFKDEREEPNKKLIDHEETVELTNRIKSKLSENEKVIFELKLQGLDNKEIAELIDKDRKYVENTIFRIGKKYKEMEK